MKLNTSKPNYLVLNIQDMTGFSLRYYGLALILGVCSVWGFAPYYLASLGLLGLVGLFYSWQRCGTRTQAVLIGWLYGMGLFGFGLHWLYISLHDVGGMPYGIAIITVALLCAFLALFPALAGAMSYWGRQHCPRHSWLVMPLCWVGLEWIRGWIFTGLPWLVLGYSQVPHSPLVGYLPIIGIYGVSLLLALSASALCHLSLSKAVMLVFSLWLGGWGAQHLNWTVPDSSSARVALLQGNIAQTIKWSEDTLNATLEDYMAMIERITDAQIIILPETAFPIVRSEIPHIIQLRIQRYLQQHPRTQLVIGMVEAQQGQYFNSLVDMRSGQSYQKSHLVPFGEFIPFKILLGAVYRDVLHIPLHDLSAGATPPRAMPIGQMMVGMNICYEDIFGEEIIHTLPQANLLINASNDAWYGESFASAQHMQFSQARALETGRMVLRATNTGVTAVINTGGQLVAQAPLNTKSTLQATIQGYQGSTPYVDWGNGLFIVLECLGVAYLMWQRRRGV